MDNITNVKIVECDESMYLKPARMLYEQNGIKKSWDLMRIHDSVGIIIFNVTREVLLFVKQFRPGMTIELCAGIVDKVQSLAETARDEILEECGYSVPLTSLQRVTSYRSGVGVTGSNQTLFYVEVTDSMKVSQGGGNNYEGEYIEVIEMDLEQAYSLIYDEKVPRPASLMLALMWFFRNKTSRIVQKL
ncbi:uridine diphosphate glucose pyrophosphatase NUDT14-like isoform X2 [Stegodyphus dumicola]|uniref:uridine diphosphate glucose pyrophosphatase NUDT14-like isoform X2 n=1 Tax=Stegodyphus dumicola TaxID=202533 RepID=UPI0015A7733E|nr:uridine diphosphate glucose pyrophosphatase NUDT14-like isoform X2 [Stegodyphus dumicola]